MTYRELLDALNRLSETQLDHTIIVGAEAYFASVLSFVPAAECDATDALDEGQMVLDISR